MRRVMGKGPPLTPVSSHDGKVVAANLLEGNHHQPNNRGVPGVGFTLPPIASVGMGEDEARAADIKFPRQGRKNRELVFRAPSCRDGQRIQNAGRRRQRAHSRRS